ncbi:hypothetical protein [Mangrovimonas futianensis]|uniref:hypothetical protein n=1 Tax=Mangrovimonas futianensis TaxID=2895523 RepID=UPI001E463F21|nr:hypothetical protein [Mangrovimonas futianensis]MCF1420434.1 hypothetical protein [Mangrovimonas futianensis]
MSDKRLIPEKINIIDFKIIKGLISSPFEFDSSLIKGHDFSLGFETALNIEENKIKADFKVSIKTQSEKNEVEEATGDFHFVFLFYVENMQDLIFEINDSKGKSKNVQVDASLGNALASITYSTSRGILMTRFQGTSLDSFILPVINPNDLIE